MNRDFLTTAEAAAYCGFKTASALRRAKLEGRLHPAGQRGGLGTWMWRRSDLDEFLVGRLAPPISGPRAGRSSPNSGRSSPQIRSTTTRQKLTNLRYRFWDQVVLQVVLHVWQVVLQTKKPAKAGSFHFGFSNDVRGLGSPRTGKQRAGEGIRTLDVNLGKVALYH
jgi:hypothetical protein